MKLKVTALLILFFALNLYAQTTGQTAAKADELLQHLSAAETFQISGDLENARIENRAIVGIALQRAGNVALEEGKYSEAVKLLADSLDYQDNAANRTNLAVAYLRSNQLDSALAQAQSAVALDAKHAPAYYILGNIYFTRGDYELALPALEKVMILAPDFDAARALGLTYLYLKQPDRAKLLFEEIQSTLKKESPEVHILFGQAYEQTNYPLEAEREFKRALVINPKQPKANFFLGYVILQHGGSDRLGEAAAAFEKELELTPDDFYANFFAGAGASNENKHEKAIKYLQKAAQLDPQKSETFLFLGQSQMEMNDLAGAEKSLRRAVQLEKSDAKSKYPARRTHYLLGRLLLKTNRKEEGEKELATASRLQQELIDSARSEINQILGQVVQNPQLNPSNNSADVAVDLPAARKTELTKIKAYLGNVLAQAYHNLGVIAVQKNSVDEALANFAAASKWKTDFPGLDRNWGIVSFRAGQFKTAIDPLARHLKSNPSDNLIRQMLGASYYFAGEFAKSVETLKPFEAVLTSNPELTYFYVISLVQTKRNQEAVPILIKLAEASQKNAEALAYAAQGFMILGDFERAAKEYRAVLALAPETPKANYYVGQSLIRLNRFDQAESYFAKELELNPVDAAAKYHLALTLIERKIELDRTVSLLEDAVRLDYNYADARYQLGKIYLEKGETEKAVEQLEAAAAVDPNKDFIQYQLSIAYRKASRKEDADRALKRYQELKASNRKIESPMGNNENKP